MFSAAISCLAGDTAPLRIQLHDWRLLHQPTMGECLDEGAYEANVMLRGLRLPCLLGEDLLQVILVQPRGHDLFNSTWTVRRDHFFRITSFYAIPYDLESAASSSDTVSEAGYPLANSRAIGGMYHR